MENWQIVLFESMRSQTLSPYMVALYYISWVFLGNFILLNLFLAILLDSFLVEEDEDENIEELNRQKKKKIQQSKNKKKKRNQTTLNLDIHKNISKLDNPELKSILQDHNSEGEDLEDLDEE